MVGLAPVCTVLIYKIKCILHSNMVLGLCNFVCSNLVRAELGYLGTFLDRERRITNVLQVIFPGHLSRSSSQVIFPGHLTSSSYQVILPGDLTRSSYQVILPGKHQKHDFINEYGAHQREVCRR